MRIFGAAALLALVETALPGCSVRRTLDQETMDEIKAACRLTGSRVGRQNGRTVIEVHFDDDTNDKMACMQREIRERNLAAHLYFGDLGVPKMPPEVAECMDRRIAEKGLRRLADLATFEAECSASVAGNSN